MNTEEIDEHLRRIKGYESAADLLESLGPLGIVAGIVAAPLGLVPFGVSLVIGGVFAVLGAAFFRERAYEHRHGAEELLRSAQEKEAETIRKEATARSFVVTEERLEALLARGAGKDVILALRPYLSNGGVVKGTLLVPCLEQRIGIKRTTESLPAVVDYLVDRRAVSDAAAVTPDTEVK